MPTDKNRYIDPEQNIDRPAKSGPPRRNSHILDQELVQKIKYPMCRDPETDYPATISKTKKGDRGKKKSECSFHKKHGRASVDRAEKNVQKPDHDQYRWVERTVFFKPRNPGENRKCDCC